ncbi:MAG TPA: MerR family transcriptional regulator [Terriglobales bacterium]|jgi:DNA-binding transcriptional MerR regulator|nr:MerR family transcriptional regulator [Terriglobales bacterium]
MDTYDSKTASRIVGVSLRQLQYWDEQNFIRPSVRLAEGRGTKRLYSFHDLVCLKVVKDLARHGFTLQTIRRCLTPLKKHSSQTQHPSQSMRYLTDGEEMFILTSDREKILDAIERQFVVSLGIGNLVRELNGQAKREIIGAQRKRSKKLRHIDVKGSGSA